MDGESIYETEKRENIKRNKVLLNKMVIKLLREGAFGAGYGSSSGKEGQPNTGVRVDVLLLHSYPHGV
jgi:hypothetical protein